VLARIADHPASRLVSCCHGVGRPPRIKLSPPDAQHLPAGPNKTIYSLATGSCETAVPSPTYAQFEEAMRRRQQILCSYDGHPRELCPIILGHTEGQQVALTYQFADTSSRPLPPGGQWKCLRLSKVSGVQLRDGPWHAGENHMQRQSCVQIVDLDINPDSPYSPQRRY
jgi:hypothetical protein